MEGHWSIYFWLSPYNFPPNTPCVLHYILSHIIFTEKPTIAILILFCPLSCRITLLFIFTRTCKAQIEVYASSIKIKNFWLCNYQESWSAKVNTCLAVSKSSTFAQSGEKRTSGADESHIQVQQYPVLYTAYNLYLTEIGLFLIK